jgi:hypothetical protein
VRVIELEVLAATRALVRPERQVQQFVREDEDQVVVVELFRKRRIGDQPPRGKHPHRRHAWVERDAHLCRKSREVRERNGQQLEAAFDASELVLTGVGATTNSGIGDRRHGFVTCFSSASMAGSAPSSLQ